MAPLIALTSVLVACLSLTACSSGGSDDAAADSTAATTTVPTDGTTAGSIDAEAPAGDAPVDLSGEWKQTNSNADDSWQAATITDATIQINWVSDNGDTKSLYWAGTFEVPADSADSFTVVSTNDHEQTDAAMLASSDDTKDFTYKDGEISYEVSALGTTTTVRLQRQ
ncbi:hypothetical protein ET495_09840 [Xylanimonas allomyrinae]|uniref:Lipoprotein n=2 Tax=Xylanimonas allomyrinae TaxID=2509459 RepID=A0A4P6EWA5_9MICO|nr:hypothetical protein ET495_09840 [Xylanimonas allomyrinae]